MLKVKLDNLIFEAKFAYFLKIVTSSKYPETLLDYNCYVFDNISKSEFSLLVKTCRDRNFFIKMPVHDPKNKKTPVYWSEEFNESSMKKYMVNISKTYKFKTRETLSREVVSQVSEFIVKSLSRVKIIKVFSIFEGPIEIKKYFESGDSFNSLVFDLLFYYSFTEKSTLLDILVEFLNPSYYVIDSDVTSQKMFEAIDGAVRSSIEEDCYSVWIDKASKYIKTLKSINNRTSKNKIPSKGSFDIEASGRKLLYKDNELPLSGGLREMFIKLYDNAEIYNGGLLIKEGRAIHRVELQKLGNYRSDSSFRTALKTLRSKLEECKIPAEIFPKIQSNYILVIKHDIS